MTNLDQEEREILEAFEQRKLRSIDNLEVELKKHREYAAETFKKDKRISIRISNRDLERLRKRALQEGLPYQTLITSILHKYVDGRLKETA
jgi:predicted DNA binding CopG/RHH family protein